MADAAAAPTELPELREVRELAEQLGGRGRLECLTEIPLGEDRLPVLALCLGNPDPGCPAIGVFGGVHGLERIGAEVALAFLRSLVHRLRWDQSLQLALRQLRLVFLPVVNPGGLALGTRANPQGVDLMRNAPLEAEGSVPWPLGGQRLSPRLPWYRGEPGRLEAESEALCALVRRELLGRPFSLAVDCHSGFGVQDQLWFPYAYRAEPAPHLAEFLALGEIFEQTQIHHQYRYEPQALQYRTHGDLWDHLYLESQRAHEGCFLPLTLEMGSWLWVKKNPRQLFSRYGIFNPLIGHRHQRVMRRHLSLLDFLLRAVLSHEQWRPLGSQRAAFEARGRARWYEGVAA
ncbi:MAG TPA: M14 family zinc carboxypeptidase [Nevskiaceae bacterium]|nr:M14 family zinc carboxypeptidase [Nevskiaceae bacterium]